jgi:competence ComEA-like helix-hairpin-helix protein
MKFLEEYFYYTRAERQGAFLLILLLVLAVLAPRFYPLLIEEDCTPLEEFEAQAIAFLGVDAAEWDEAAALPEARLFHFDPNTISEDSLQLLGLSPKLAGTIVRYREKGGRFRRAEDLQKIYTLKAADYERLAPYIRLERSGFEPRAMAANLRGGLLQPQAELFAFDPNTATAEEFQRLGLSARIAGNIVKYREKGGRFRAAADFGKIYGLKETDFQRLQPYIQIEAPPSATETPEPVADKATSPRPAPALLTIDINAATADDWQQLRGIGPAFARRILNYREKLGGFSSIEQVAETYGLPDSTFQRIRPQLEASPVFRKININVADSEALKAHPYLNWKQANILINYRAQHGPYRSFEEVRKVEGLPEEVMRKMEPYLEY